MSLQISRLVVKDRKVYGFNPKQEINITTPNLYVIAGPNGAGKTIRRRFKRGLENLMTTYRFLADDWQVYDNQTDEPRMVAFGKIEGTAFKDQNFYASVEQFLEKK